MQSSTVSRDAEKFSINFYVIIFRTRSIIWTFWIQIVSDTFKFNLHLLLLHFNSHCLSCNILYCALEKYYKALYKCCILFKTESKIKEIVIIKSINIRHNIEYLNKCGVVNKSQ